MVNELGLIVKCKNIKGAQFVSVRNYTSVETGEISNQTFNVGLTYDKALQSDLQAIQTLDLKPIIEKFGGNIDLVTEAKRELEASLLKRLADEKTKADLLAAGDTTMKKSKAQTDAYIALAPGLKCKFEGQKPWLYLYGFMVRKTVVKQGVYKDVKSAPLTLAKRAIEKLAKLKSDKYRLFKLGDGTQVAIQGAKFDFEAIRPATA